MASRDDEGSPVTDRAASQKSAGDASNGDRRGAGETDPSDVLSGQLAALMRLAAETLDAPSVWMSRGRGNESELLSAHGEVPAEAPSLLLRLGTSSGAEIGDPAGTLVGMRVDVAGMDDVVLAARIAERRSARDARAALGRFVSMAAALLAAPGETLAAGAEPASDYQGRLIARVESIAHIGSFHYRSDGWPVEWSEEMFRLLGRPVGAPATLGELVSAFTEEAQAKLRPAIAEALETGTPFDIEAPLITGDGQLKLVRLLVEAPDGEGGRHLLGIGQDVTERREYEDRTWRLSNHDFLTRLPNRRLLEESLERALEVARLNGGKVGLLLLDLDYFKEINTSLGHDTGDVLLHVIAGRLRRAVGPDDEVARTGGDEFAVLMRDPEAPASLMRLSRKILKAIEQPVPIRGSEVAVRASIGGALFPEHARGVGEMLDSAHAALARAKTTGRRIGLVYDEQMGHLGDTRFRIHESIRGALSRDEIVPYYQPKVDLETRAVVGLEALVRWRSGPSGLVFPTEFGSALSDGFLGSAIATRVLEKVTDDIREWLEAGLPFGSVAVNVTAIELMRGAYHEQVSEILQRKDIPFDRFQVEVTETVFLQFEGQEIRETIRKLDALGVEVALDDFGTGFGSLVHLRRLAVSQIKIDRSFIERIDTQPEDEAIVRALIALGKDLGKRVIAEGIEREEERLALLKLGCAEGQGFLFGLPSPKAETAKMLGSERVRGTP